MTKTVCYQFIGLFFFFFSQLELLKRGELLLPKSLSDTCWMGQAQLCSLHRFSSHCDPAWLPAIHMCYFPFVVMACGTWPENIINFRSALTNNKPTVKREEVLRRPAVGWSRAVGDSMYAGSRRGDDNPQRGNALKLSTAQSKEKRKEKTKEKRNQRKERGGGTAHSYLSCSWTGNC